MWLKFEEVCKSSYNINGRIIGKVNKGGFAVEIYKTMAFLPGSQLDLKQIKDPSVLNKYVPIYKNVFC